MTGDEACARVQKQVSDEQFVSRHVDLLTHLPITRDKVNFAFASVEILATMATKEFMHKSQQAIFSLNGKESTYQTAFLSNTFRQASLVSSTKSHAEIDKELEPVRSYLLTVIERPDMRVDRLIHGNAGLHRNLTEGVSELKIDTGPGYRAHYSIRKEQLLLLLAGGSKATQDKAIEKALEINR